MGYLTINDIYYQCLGLTFKYSGSLFWSGDVTSEFKGIT